MDKTIRDLPNESRYDEELKIKLDAILIDDIKKDMILYFDITKEDVEKVRK